MNEKEAIQIIHDELVGENGIIVSLNLRKYFSEESFKRLEKAMIFLADSFKTEKYIPKEVAGAFVDLSSHFERCYGFYTEKEQEKIFDLKEKIVDLALEMLDVG